MKPLLTQSQINTVKRNLSKNSPLIMTGLGIAGSLGALWGAFKVAPKASKILKDIDENHKPNMTKPQIFWEKTKAVAPLVWPVVVMEGVSIGCTIGSYKTSTNRLSSALTAYAISERRFEDYRKKVVESIGKNKEDKVRTEVAKESVEKSSSIKNVGDDIILLGDEKIFLDLFTQQVFKSTIGKVEDAEKRFNRDLPTEMWVSLNEFLYEIGEKNIGYGDDIGWDVNRNIMEITIKPIMTENKQTVYTIDYDVVSRFRYGDGVY